MTVQLSTTTRDAQLSAWNADTGSSAKILIYSGAMPGNCADSATGDLLVTFSLIASWLGTPSSGVVDLSNLPLSAVVLASGIAGYFRITHNDGVTCSMQGTITADGDGGDMTLDNTSLSSGNTINLLSFSVTEGNP